MNRKKEKSNHSGRFRSRRNDLRADHNTLATGSLGLVLVVVLGGAVGRVVAVAAAGTAAVEFDTIAAAGDAKALTSAAAAAGAHARGAGAVGGTRGERGHIGAVVRVVVGLVVVGLGIEGLVGKAGGQSLERGLVVLGVDDLACLVGALWAWGNDARWRNTAALWDGGSADAAGLAGGALTWCRGRCLGLSRNVEDVELAAGGGLGGGVLGRVVRDVVAVNDVVVPVPLALLQGGALELEASQPAAALLGVLGEGKLARVVVPRAEQVDRLAVAGSAESEVELDSGHYGRFDIGIFR
jgi:hypothetical protein